MELGYIIREMQATSSPVIRVEEEGLTKQPQARVIPDLDTLKRSDLQFNKLQHLDEDINQDNKYFGEFVAREAVLDEEYWVSYYYFITDWIVNDPIIIHKY